MTASKTVPIAAIDAGGRIRPVDEAHAQAIGASIAARGLINRIGLRPTPNGKLKWKLVTGAHRLRGLEIAGIAELMEGEHFTVLKADADEARLLEAEENLARHDLTVLDRALTIRAYRQAWERKFGTIKSGPRADKGISLTRETNSVWPGEDPQPGEFIAAGAAVSAFSEWVSDRLGLSRAAHFRLVKIAALQTDLVARLRGTPAADHQRLLLDLADMEPERQQAIAAAMALGRSLDEAIGDTDPHAAAKQKASAAEKRVSAVIGNYQYLGDQARRDVLRQLYDKFPDDFDWLLEGRKEARRAA